MGGIFIIPRGGLGNLLFNYMIGYALSKKYSMRLYFISTYPGSRRKMYDYKMFKHCNFVRNPPVKAIRIKEHGLQYQDICIVNTQCDYILDGYFGSYKYSIDYLPEIKRLLIDNHPDYPLSVKEYTRIVDNKISIAVHVRRGDYLRLKDTFIVQPNSYYQSAITKTLDHLGLDKNDVRLLIFSDDIPFITNWELVQHYDHHIVTETNAEKAFILMSLCNNFIIANSTFSLLAYYFRNPGDAYLCFPQKWYGKKIPNNITDLILFTKNVEMI